MVSMRARAAASRRTPLAFQPGAIDGPCGPSVVIMLNGGYVSKGENRMRTLYLAVWTAGIVLGQSTEEPVILTIDVENHVLYRGNVFDAAKLAKDPGPTMSVN